MWERHLCVRNQLKRKVANKEHLWKTKAANSEAMMYNDYFYLPIYPLLPLPQPPDLQAVFFNTILWYLEKQAESFLYNWAECFRESENTLFEVNVAQS